MNPLMEENTDLLPSPRDHVLYEIPLYDIPVYQAVHPNITDFIQEIRNAASETNVTPYAFALALRDQDFSQFDFNHYFSIDKNSQCAKTTYAFFSAITAICMFLNLIQALSESTNSERKVGLLQALVFGMSGLVLINEVEKIQQKNYYRSTMGNLFFKQLKSQFNDLNVEERQQVLNTLSPL